MRIFEIVKENVNLREAAELYGIDVNRYGKALCPFHNDRNPSLYVADDHYYCFACGEHGREGEIATDQIRTVDKSRLKRKIGDLNFSEIKRLREVFQQMFCE